jgi:hypothetical protein
METDMRIKNLEDDIHLLKYQTFELKKQNIELISMVNSLIGKINKENISDEIEIQIRKPPREPVITSIERTPEVNEIYKKYKKLDFGYGEITKPKFMKLAYESIHGIKPSVRGKESSKLIVDLYIEEIQKHIPGIKVLSSKIKGICARD